MRVLTADINGIIRELSLNENDILIPLFECVVNAIQAIDECNDRTQGYIDINITRDETQTELFEQYSTFTPYRLFIAIAVVTVRGIPL